MSPERGALLTVGALFSSVSLSEARSDVITCQPTQGRNGEIAIALSDGRFEGTELSCIYGDFIYDMSPCAPSGGGVGMSYPTGTASLRALGTRWQDYLDHSGGVVGHGISSKEISFYGGFNFPETGFTNKWTFAVNRITGRGVLKIDGSSFRYTCRAARQKF
jgi:hypothetical protein